VPHSIQEDAGRDKQHREGHLREGDDEEVAAGGEREAVNAITATLVTTVTGRSSWSRPASVPPTPRDDAMPAVKGQNTAGDALADLGDDVVAMLDQMPQLITAPTSGAAGFSDGVVCAVPASTPTRHQGARGRASGEQRSTVCHLWHRSQLGSHLWARRGRGLPPADLTDGRRPVSNAAASSDGCAARERS